MIITAPQKNTKRIVSILKAADNILIYNGYHNFTMRKVATKANVSVGNLQYYFPSKESLLEALLDNVIQDYLKTFEKIINQNTPSEQFIQIIKKIVKDLQTKRATIFFPELWSMANHKKHFSKCMDIMYEKYRSVLAKIISDINPELSELQVKRLSLFFSSSLEGHTMFIGYRKVWTKEAKNIVNISLQSFLWLIENGDIPALACAKNKESD